MKRRPLISTSSIIDPRSSLRCEALQVGRRRLVARVGAVARLDHAQVQTVHPELERTPVVGEHAPLGNVPGAGAGVGARIGGVELARLAGLEGEAVLKAPAHAATAVDAHTLQPVMSCGPPPRFLTSTHSSVSVDERPRKRVALKRTCGQPSDPAAAAIVAGSPAAKRMARTSRDRKSTRLN